MNPFRRAWTQAVQNPLFFFLAAMSALFSHTVVHGLLFPYTTTAFPYGRLILSTASTVLLTLGMVMAQNIWCLDNRGLKAYLRALPALLLMNTPLVFSPLILTNIYFDAQWNDWSAWVRFWVAMVLLLILAFFTPYYLSCKSKELPHAFTNSLRIIIFHFPSAMAIFFRMFWSFLLLIIFGYGCMFTSIITTYSIPVQLLSAIPFALVTPPFLLQWIAYRDELLKRFAPHLF